MHRVTFIPGRTFAGYELNKYLLPKLKHLHHQSVSCHSVRFQSESLTNRRYPIRESYQYKVPNQQDGHEDGNHQVVQEGEGPSGSVVETCSVFLEGEGEGNRGGREGEREREREIDIRYKLRKKKIDNKRHKNEERK